MLRFRSHVGHAFAPEVLLCQKSEELEAALWSDLHLLKKKATLMQQLTTRPRAADKNWARTQAADRIAEQAEPDIQHARVIQELLEDMPRPMDQAAVGIEALNQGDTAARPQEVGVDEDAMVDTIGAGRNPGRSAALKD